MTRDSGLGTRNSSPGLVESWEVPSGPARAEVRERASRFLAFVLPVANAEDASGQIEALEKAHHDASHVCYAWKVGEGAGARRRASDAGEPSGTAGAPIAAAVNASGLTDVLVAVVRHFGGTRLGKGNLARAYREAAARALAAAPRKTVWATRRIEVSAAWDRISAARRLIAPPEVRLLEETSGELCRLVLEVRATRAATLLERLREARLEAREVPAPAPAD